MALSTALTPLARRVVRLHWRDNQGTQGNTPEGRRSGEPRTSSSEGPSPVRNIDNGPDFEGQLIALDQREPEGVGKV